MASGVPNGKSSVDSIDLTLSFVAGTGVTAISRKHPVWVLSLIATLPSFVIASFMFLLSFCPALWIRAVGLTTNSNMLNLTI